MKTLVALGVFLGIAPMALAEIPAQRITELKDWASRFVCKDPKHCQSGIAKVQIYNPDGSEVGGCTGTLTPENTVVTNSHCIPQDISTRGSDCSQRIIAVLPAVNGSSPEALRCAKVLFAGPNHFPDVGIFSLEGAPQKQMAHPPIKRSFDEGLAFSYVHFSFSPYPVMRSQECQLSKACDLRDLTAGLAEEGDLGNSVVQNENGALVALPSSKEQLQSALSGQIQPFSKSVTETISTLSSPQYVSPLDAERKAGPFYGTKISHLTKPPTGPYTSPENFVSCDGPRCHQSIAAVRLMDKNCTGVLVADDVVAIPSICVPKEFEKIPSDCLDLNTYISFAQEGDQQFERLGCLDVAYNSATEGVALLKLLTKPKFHRPISGVATNALKLSISTVHSDYNTYQIETTSHVAQKTIISPQFKAGDFSQPTLTDCPVGPGNSGSPLLDDKGNLVGVIGGQINQQLLGEVVMLAHQFRLFTDESPNWKKESVRQLGWAMNLSALPSFSDLTTRDFDFSKLVGLEKKLSTDDVFNVDFTSYISLFDQWKLHAPAYIKWETEVKSWYSIPLFGPKPKCYYKDKLPQDLAQGTPVSLPMGVTRINSALQPQNELNLMTIPMTLRLEKDNGRVQLVPAPSYAEGTLFLLRLPQVSFNIPACQ